jgi:hypothetical protein
MYSIQASPNEEEEIPEPAEIDAKLESPKFMAELPTEHAYQLEHLLRFDQRKMTKAQRTAFRAYLDGFNTHYSKMENYLANEELHCNTKLLDLLFERIVASTPNLDGILACMVILSRHTKEKGPDGGKEPRITKILDVMRERVQYVNIIREASRALINYAQVNAKLINDSGGFDAINGAMNRFASNEQVLSAFLLLFRNLSVQDCCRKVIVDRFGFIVTNGVSMYHRDSGIPENACYVLGNVALLPELCAYLANAGVVQSIKNAMDTFQDEERVQEAASWFLFTATEDEALVKQISKGSFEEVIIRAHKKFSAKNANLKMYTEHAMLRIRNAVMASTPTAIADRYFVCVLFDFLIELFL